MKSSKGFTLIELLVTLVIAGILALLIAPGLIHYLQESNVRLAQEILETELSASFSQSRSYPQIFGVEGVENTPEIFSFSCSFPECSDKKRTPIPLSAKNKNAFEIRFLPPHGDIDEASFTGDSFLLKVANSDNLSRSLLIHKYSGFIERK